MTIVDGEIHHNPSRKCYIPNHELNKEIDKFNNDSIWIWFCDDDCETFIGTNKKSWNFSREIFNNKG